MNTFAPGQRIEFAMTAEVTVAAEVVAVTEGVVTIRVERDNEDYYRRVQAGKLAAKEQVGA